MTSQEQPLSRNKVVAVFNWCLPCLLGAVLFLFSFPIDRSIPFWPHMMIVEIFFLWFLFVTPPATVIALVVFMKRKRSDAIPTFTKSLIWTTLALSILVNAFMLIGLWAAIYF
jgi:hypothetical protein